MTRRWAICVLFGTAGLLLGGCPLTPTGDGGDTNTPTGTLTLTITAAGPDQAAAGEAVTLTVTVTDPDATDPLSYAWIQTAGPGVALSGHRTAEAGFTAPSRSADTTLSFYVTVVDARGAIGRATVTLTITADPDDDDDSATGDGPQAVVGSDRSIAEGVEVVLDGSASRGLALSYAWTQTAGDAVTINDANQPQASFVAPTYITGGLNRYEFELTVTDPADATDTATVVITVLRASQPRVLVETTLGDFLVELDPNAAPITVANFLQYVDDGFYDSTIFHHVIAEYILAGGYTADLTLKDTRDPIVSEADNGLTNARGTIGMVRAANDPDSAAAQFYVNVTDNPSFDEENDTPAFTVFGRVIQGLAVIDQIAAAETAAEGDFTNLPVTTIEILSITRAATLTVSADGPDSAEVGDSVELTATVNDNDAEPPLTYEWTQTAGTDVTLTGADSETASFTAPSLGDDEDLTFRLRVIDDRGVAGLASVTVSIEADPDHVDFTVKADPGDDQEVEGGDAVTLDGSDSNGLGLTYAWTQTAGDSVNLSGADTATATFTAPAYDSGGDNVYEFELTVTDENSDSDSATVQVTVVESVDPDAPPRVRFITSLGDIVVELDPNLAPNTVDNFLAYVDADFYDGTIFHRVINGPNFHIAQGGGFDPGLVTADGIGDPIDLEVSAETTHTRGTIAMARTSDPDSATTQFFFNVQDNSDAFDTDVNPPGYAVFGTVIEGLDTLDTIVAVATSNQDNPDGQTFSDVPVSDVIVTEVRRISN